VNFREVIDVILTTVVVVLLTIGYVELKTANERIAVLETKITLLETRVKDLEGKYTDVNLKALQNSEDHYYVYLALKGTRYDPRRYYHADP